MDCIIDGGEIMMNENFDPMQEKHMKIVVDVLQLVKCANYSFIISMISIIISLISIYRSCQGVS